MKEFSYEEVRAATGDFSADRLVGKGSHGCVYRAALAVEVAVKKSSAAAPGYLDNEIDILSAYSSRRIVNLVGVASSPGKTRLLVLDYMPNGSLEELLHSGPGLPELAWRAAVAIQAGRALAGLHRANPPIIHRDVKSANVLFDGRWRARLADFGLAVRAGGPDRLAAGTMGYIDPGYVGPRQLGPGVDVFSFGVVVMELVSGRRSNRERQTGEGLGGRMMGVAARCVASDGGKRPAMDEVVAELEMAAERVWWPLGVARRWVRRGWRKRKGEVARGGSRVDCND